MNRKKCYKDKEKWKKTCERQKRKYYKRTAYNRNYKKRWTEEEIKIILEHKITDSEISSILGRSVMSIAVKRSKIKKESD